MSIFFSFLTRRIRAGSLLSQETLEIFLNHSMAPQGMDINIFRVISSRIKMAEVWKVPGGWHSLCSCCVGNTFEIWLIQATSKPVLF